MLNDQKLQNILTTSKNKHNETLVDVVTEKRFIVEELMSLLNEI